MSEAVRVQEAGLRGMITLRADLNDKAVQAVCKAVTGADFPAQGQITMSGDNGMCWMSPDELLLLVPYGAVAEAVAQIDKALAGKHYLAEDVSDARALLIVSGPYAREVIAKLAPVDMHPGALRPGVIRRTRLGQVAAAFWMRDAQTFEVICFRSVAGYTFDLLTASAKAGRVGVF